jgi:ABC-type polysaccharide/polyol phosphate transport system ATPase subunit
MSGDGVAIEVRDLHKSFRIPTPGGRSLRSRLLHPVEVSRPQQLHVLRGISFDVRGGEFFGIVGRNGSGKSTLLRTLSSIYHVDRGSVRVAGRVGPLIELGVGFDSELSARENIVLNGVMLGLSPRELRRRADQVLEFAEVEQFGDVALKNFSSGMRVRLAFAALVQADPEILLIDEILAVGDAGFREKCHQTFDELKRSGKTIVFVTHNMHDVQRFCDRAMLLEAGEIAEFSEPADVTRRYYEVTLRHRRSETDVVEQPETDRAAMDLARIAELRLSRSDGVGLDDQTVDAQSPIEIEARIDPLGPVRASGLRFEIRTEYGARIFAPPDDTVGVEPVESAPGETIVAKASIENRLAPGRYVITCTVLHEDEGRPIAASPAKSLDFIVAGEVRRGKGLVFLAHDVQLEPARFPAATP